MTELTFLIELLLNHELAKVTKDLIATRIKEVEEKLNNGNTNVLSQPGVLPYHTTSLTPNLVRHVAQEEPVIHTAQTAAAAAALNARADLINQAINRKLPSKNRQF